MSWHEMMNSISAEGTATVNVNSGRWCHADPSVIYKAAHSLSPYCFALLLASLCEKA